MYKKKFLINIILKIILFIVVPLGLILSQLFPSLNSRVDNFTSFSFYSLVEENAAIFSQQQTKPLYKGDKIQGEFTASEDNLGLVLIKLTNFDTINKGQMQFKFKEKGAKAWKVDNRYTVDQIQPDAYFAFGLPVFADAKGKAYEFELMSLNGKKGDAIGLSSQKPQFAAVYNFLGSELKANPPLLTSFLYQKVIFALSNSNSFQIILMLMFYYSTFIVYRKVRASLGKKGSRKIFSQTLTKKMQLIAKKTRKFLKVIEVE